ncbi:hypothetical protein BB559_004081 [Furculomyces boomerangus]|uniref:Uncharacterized protein n=1 Tax=Furculomyces boomerangus TaxID=61424 RepID=A0A2T9YGR4_9FUNG|nr:hypothetical protein BB559_004081 [Furculomyces boomerangus]
MKFYGNHTSLLLLLSFYTTRADTTKSISGGGNTGVSLNGNSSTRQSTASINKETRKTQGLSTPGGILKHKKDKAKKKANKATRSFESNTVNQTNSGVVNQGNGMGLLDGVFSGTEISMWSETGASTMWNETGASTMWNETGASTMWNETGDSLITETGESFIQVTETETGVSSWMETGLSSYQIEQELTQLETQASSWESEWSTRDSQQKSSKESTYSSMATIVFGKNLVQTEPPKTTPVSICTDSISKPSSSTITKPISETTSSIPTQSTSKPSSST